MYTLFLYTYIGLLVCIKIYVCIYANIYREKYLCIRIYTHIYILKEIYRKYPQRTPTDRVPLIPVFASISLKDSSGRKLGNMKWSKSSTDYFCIQGKGGS